MLKHLGAWLAAAALIFVLVLLGWLARPSAGGGPVGAGEAALARRVALEFGELHAALDPSVPGSTRGAADRSRTALQQAVTALDDVPGERPEALATAGREALALAVRLDRDATRIADHVAMLRGEGPEAVRALRANGNALAAERAFSVITRAIDFAERGQGEAERLAADIDTFRSEGPVAPAFTGVLEAATALLAARRDAEAAYEDLTQLPIPALAEALEASALATDSGRWQRQAWVALVTFAALSCAGMVLLTMRQWRGRAAPAAAAAAGGRSAAGGADAQDDDLALRLAEQLTVVDDALADLDIAQRGAARHGPGGDDTAARLATRMQTPLWFLRSNTRLVDERMTHLQTFVAEAAGTLALFGGEHTDRQRIAEGLTRLRRMLREHQLEETIGELRALLQDNGDALEELIRELGLELDALQSADPPPLDLAVLVAGVVGEWSEGRPDVEVHVAIAGPLLADVAAEPLQRALARCFDALCPAEVTPPDTTLDIRAQQVDGRLDLLLERRLADADAQPRPAGMRLDEDAGAGLHLAIAARLADAAGAALRLAGDLVEDSLVLSMPECIGAPAARTPAAGAPRDDDRSGVLGAPRMALGEQATTG